MPYASVIFDLDGTLADTLADIAGAMNHVLRQFEFPTHPVHDYRKFVGDGVRMLIERALPEGHKHRVEEVLLVYLPHLVEYGVDTAELYPGIAGLLDELTKRGVKVAVCSNKPHASTVDVVNRLMSRWTLAGVQGHTEPYEKKPSPEMALMLAGKMDVEPRQCLFVGDSNVDVETAANAGMTSVGVAWGFRGPQELIAAGADHLIQTPGELLDLLDG